MQPKSRLHLIALAVLVLIAGAGLYTVIRGRAQQYFVSELAERLEAHGLPVASIEVTSRLPEAVTIQLQSKSSTNRLQEGDLKHLRQVEGEVGKLSTAGSHPESYRIEIRNNQGESIFSVQNSLPADDSQPFEPLAADVASFQYKLHALPAIRLEQLVVSRIGGSADSGQEIEVQVRALDNSENNTSLDKVISAFYELLPDQDRRKNSLARGSLKILNWQGQQAFNLVLEQKGTGRREQMRGGPGTGLGWLFESRVDGGPMPTEPPFDQAQVDQRYSEIAAEWLGLNRLPGIAIEKTQVSTIETPEGSRQYIEVQIRVFDYPESLESSHNLYSSFGMFLYANEGVLPNLTHGQLQMLNAAGEIVLDQEIDLEIDEATLNGDIGFLP